MRLIGLQNYISRAYVHHVGSQTCGMDYEKCIQESRIWIEKNRPDLAPLWFNNSPKIEEKVNIDLLPEPNHQALKSVEEKVNDFQSVEEKINISPSQSENQSKYSGEKLLENKTAEEWYQLGITMTNIGQLDQAKIAYEKALNLNPNYPQAYNNLGLLAIADENIDEAIEYFKSAIRVNPSYAYGYNNIGLALQMQNKLPEAQSYLQQALQQNPTYHEALVNLGNVLRLQDHIEEAIKCFERSIELKPDYAKAYQCLGSALSPLLHQNKISVEQLRNVYLKLQSIDPNSLEAFTRLFCLREGTCDWTNRESDLKTLWRITQQEIEQNKTTTMPVFESVYKPWTRQQLKQIAVSHGQDFESQWRKKRLECNFQHSPILKGKLRIGYLSHDFRDHATSHLIQTLFNHHDRTNFEIFAYSSGVNDQSSYRNHIMTSVDQFRDIAKLDYEESAKLIHGDGINILIDLNGYTYGSRTPILALRPAPIQVNYLGFPGTMGAPFMDYLISDRIITPPKFAHDFTEKLVLLPHCYQVNDNQQVIANTPVTRQQYNLPESAFVFCSFNNKYKIEPVVFDVWMNILKKVKNSVLWLLVGDKTTQGNLQREATIRGIDAQRLIFCGYVSKAEHLARHRLADLFIDTLYCNAHTTASDCLWAGLPLITWQGETFATRVASSLLTAVGLPELITTNLDDYQKLAITLARSRDKLQAIKEKLAKNRLTYPLFDTPAFTRDLETAYQKIWNIYQQGKSPEMIELDRTPFAIN
jgi:protein O-GlcNAc transferase